jgi:hypothetical protein
MSRCEDFPCCGHELGCCPDFDEAGRQLNIVCTCGAKLPVTSRYSICEGCMERARREEDPFWDDDLDARDYDEPSDGMTDAEADADTLASAGMGTDEDYGYFGGDDGY